MTHSLEDLKLGKLVGSKSLKLACGLKEFPKEIFSLAETLEVLDLSDNHLTKLPEGILQLKNLKIIFFARNNFTEFPSILSACTSLSMIGFKSNQIKTVPEQAFPAALKWLILTDNKIEKLPKSIGDCQLLKKCLLAGNFIEELPAEITNCEGLELLRVSANKLKSIPKGLFELPKLSWLAFGGNPISQRVELDTDFETYHWDDFSVGELLGEGASGMISKSNWHSKNHEVAVKIFKGDVTSDGLPEDEMKASIIAGIHENLIPVLGKINGHPEDKSGLIMKLISPDYINLGFPPSLESCTRDIFDAQTVFDENEVLKIAKSIASVCVQLHSRGINHGDLYAHNILVNKNAECLLGDFGAASLYDINSVLAHTIERVEVRAFGCLLEDIISLGDKKNIDHVFQKKWQKLITDCTRFEVNERLSFCEILELLHKF
jgi:hypothetical protein